VLDSAKIVQSFRTHFEGQDYLSGWRFEDKEPEPQKVRGKNCLWVNFVGIRKGGASKTIAGNPTDAYDVEIGIIIPYNRLKDVHDDTEIGDIVRRIGEELEANSIDYYSEGVSTGRRLDTTDTVINFKEENEAVFKIACE